MSLAAFSRHRPHAVARPPAWPGRKLSHPRANIANVVAPLTETPADPAPPAGAAAPAPQLTLSCDEVRRITLRAQGFLGAAERRGGVGAMLRRIGAVQLDTISVLARSHELVAYARLGPVGRAAVEGAYWGRPARAFEGIA